MIRVVLADDHPALRLGLRLMLDHADGIQVVGEAEDGPSALALCRTERPDVVVLDYELPGMDGAAVAQALREAGIPVRIVALSAHDDRHAVQHMLAAGVSSYLLKSEAATRIVQAVRASEQEGYFSPTILQTVASLRQPPDPGNLAPTAREREVLVLIADGRTNGEIAAALTISERTVAYHLQNLMDKLGVNSRTEVAVQALRRGWIAL